MKTAHTFCGSCGALLFTVTYSDEQPVAFSMENDVAVLLDERDRCAVKCACGEITRAPHLKRVIGQDKSQRVH